METITIYNQHVLQALKQLPDNSIDCIVTSPPYYGLRSYKDADTIWSENPECEHEWLINISERVDYTGFERNRSGLNKMAEKIDGHKRYATTDIPPIDKNSVFCSKCGAWKGQLGLEPSYQMYLNHLLLITKELKRVLKPSGTLFWNMGDSYASEGGPSRHRGYSDPKWAKARNGSFDEPTAYPQGIKPKSLMLLPERFAIGMIDQGWILRNKIIWHKPNGIPSSVKDRFANKWEYVFFFVKSKRYFFNLDAIRKPLKEPSIKRISQNVEAQFNIGKVHDFPNNNMNMKNILIHMKQKYEGNRPISNIKHDLAVNRKRSYNDPLHTKAYNLMGVNPGDVLNISTKPHTFAHFAVFPEALVEPLIKAGCPQEGIVLDPFAGSGTTLQVALELGLDAIGIEISKDYIPLIETRTHAKERQKLGTLDYRLIV